MIPEILELRRVDGVPIVNIPHEWVFSNGTGFEWGYQGTGPMELAINILAQFVAMPEAIRLHADFLDEYIATMPHEGGTIERREIARWIAAHS